MKKLLFTLLLSSPAMAICQDSTKTSNILYEGTIVTVKLLQDISSKSADVGDTLSFETTEAISVNGKIVAPVGSKVLGSVTESEKRKMLGKSGKLNFTIDYLLLPSGRTIKLDGEQGKKGKNKTGAAVAEAVLLTPLFLLKKGKNAHFDKGQIFKAFVEKDYVLE